MHKLTLLPTPSAVSYGNNRGGAAGRVGRVRPSLEGVVKVLLPTPTATGHRGNQSNNRGEALLPGVVASATARPGVDWREYEPAIRRWEAVLDRVAPYPATRGPKGGIKVAPPFGEWLMGLPEGHIADVPGLSINEQLKLVGNGVVPQQAEHAIRYLIAQLEGNIMTTDTSSFFGEQQSNDVPRDQWGRYRLPDADGEETGWTRDTTFAATLAEQYGLSIWHQRQVVWGLSRRTDLIELAATIAGPEDKKALGSIVDEAHIAAGTEAKANRGTALHKASEIGDRANGNVGAVPPQFQQDYAAYRDTLDRAEIEILPEWIERVMITPDYHVAGTPDRLVRCADDRVRVLDLKTGNLDYAQLEWSVQLAMYAHAKAARNYATNTYEQLPEIADDYAIVAHIRPESGVCELYRVDIRMGWAFARLCAEVRDARQHKALLTPLVVEPGNAFRAVATAAAPMAAAQAHITAAVGEFDTSEFWLESLNFGPDTEDTDEGLTHNGVPLAEYGQPADADRKQCTNPDDLRPHWHGDLAGCSACYPAAPVSDDPADQKLREDAAAAGAAVITTADQEATAVELAKRPKGQLQQIARDLMAGNPGVSVKLNQHRIKIAREIVAAAIERNVEIPGIKGTGAHNAKPTAQPPAAGLDAAMESARVAGVDAAANKVVEAREAQWRATMFDAIRNALTVDKLQLLREQAGPKWDEAMTASARERVEQLDAQRSESTARTLTPLEMIRGATSRETLSKAWEVATNRGSNLDGWTAELDSAAKEKVASL